MQSYIVSQHAPNVSEAIRDTLERATNTHLKEYLERILALSPEEQERWFLSDDDRAETLAREAFRQPRGVLEACAVIVALCTVVKTGIAVWNAVKQEWEEKEVEEEVCKDKKVETPCPE